MFEKEAKERARKLKESQTLGVYDSDEDYARDSGWNDGDVAGYEEGFKDGAEFGYNKANEWHYVKDGNPNNDNDILCQISKDEVVVGYYHTVAKRYITIDGQDLYNVIAWKEIVLPKEIKENE